LFARSSSLSLEAKLVPGPRVVGGNTAETDHEHERDVDHRQLVDGGRDAVRVQDGRHSRQRQHDAQRDDDLGAEQQAANRLALTPLSALDGALGEVEGGQRHGNPEDAVPRQGVNGPEKDGHGRRGQDDDQRTVDDPRDLVGAGRDGQVDGRVVDFHADSTHSTPRFCLGKNIFRTF
jgi:hypothetical protein